MRCMRRLQGYYRQIYWLRPHDMPLRAHGKQSPPCTLFAASNCAFCLINGTYLHSCADILPFTLLIKIVYPFSYVDVWQFRAYKRLTCFVIEAFHHKSSNGSRHTTHQQKRAVVECRDVPAFAHCGTMRKVKLSENTDEMLFAVWGSSTGESYQDVKRNQLWKGSESKALGMNSSWKHWLLIRSNLSWSIVLLFDFTYIDKCAQRMKQNADSRRSLHRCACVLFKQSAAARTIDGLHTYGRPGCMHMQASFVVYFCVRSVMSELTSWADVVIFFPSARKKVKNENRLISAAAVALRR